METRRIGNVRDVAEVVDQGFQCPPDDPQPFEHCHISFLQVVNRVPIGCPLCESGLHFLLEVLSGAQARPIDDYRLNGRCLQRSLF